MVRLSQTGVCVLRESIIRFLVGGAVVSVFAILGDLLRPKSFAGLFGAAPSVALATLALTIAKHGGGYAATEGRSMILGAGEFVFRLEPIVEIATGGPSR